MGLVGSGTLGVVTTALDSLSEPSKIYEVDFEIAPTAAAGDYVVTFSKFWVNETLEVDSVSDFTVNVSAIPEPSTLAALLGMGAVALGVHRWRRRKR